MAPRLRCGERVERCGVRANEMITWQAGPCWEGRRIGVSRTVATSLAGGLAGQVMVESQLAVWGSAHKSGLV